MDERLKFVARLLDGETMSAVCREFGISRKTGYKIFNRYKDCGLEGLMDKSRCRVISVQDNIIEIDYIDAFPDIPILDIKPWPASLPLLAGLYIYK
jgi:tRNA (Thr-GGU) A37 N-methylase